MKLDSNETAYIVRSIVILLGVGYGLKTQKGIVFYFLLVLLIAPVAGGIAGVLSNRKKE